MSPKGSFPELTSGRRPVGVVSFAQYDNVRREEDRNEVEMLLPVVGEVFGNIGITKDDVGFICSGSTDYLIGGPFSFVAALDAVGAWPPSRSRTSRWTARGRSTRRGCCCSTATSTRRSCTPSGGRRLGDLARTLAVQLDPYYLAPLWPDPTSLAALQAQAMLDAGLATEEDFAAVAARRGVGAGEPEGAGGVRPLAPTSCWPSDYVVAPLRRHDVAAVTDGVRRDRAGGGRPAYEWCERPALITGIDHRIETHSSGARDLTARRRPGGRREGGRGQGRSTWPNCTLPSRTRSWSCRGAGLGDGVTVNPSGGALAANPMMVGGVDPHRRGGAARSGRAARTGRVAHATSGPCLQQNLVCRAGGWCDGASVAQSSASGRRCAKSKREDVSIAGLVREAAAARRSRTPGSASPTSTPWSSARRPTCSRA